MRQRPRPWTSVLLLDTSRLARKPIIAVLFERDAERNGVRVIYKSIPDDDPITGQLIKSVFRALDEYHSLISKAKGLRAWRKTCGKASERAHLEDIDSSPCAPGQCAMDLKY